MEATASSLTRGMPHGSETGERPWQEAGDKLARLWREGGITHL